VLTEFFFPDVPLPFLFLLLLWERRSLEGHCTSESERGQFSIFGAIEEKSGQGLCRMNMGQEESWKPAVKLCGGDGFLFRSFGEGEFGSTGSRNIHRRRTGNAESSW
jgi:hypothetical protein